MSLNWREIDAILEELDLRDCWLRRIRQPDYSRIILEFSRSGHTEAVELVLRAPFTRINRIGAGRRLPKALPRPPRFAAVVKSRLEGARLLDFGQLGEDRIVRFTFTGSEKPVHLDAKLWGNGANLILCDDEGIVTDTFSRRPGRGEAPGGTWPPEGIPDHPVSPDPSRSPGKYPLRSLRGDGDWNSRIESHYLDLEKLAELNRRKEAWQAWIRSREVSLVNREKRLEKGRERFEGQLRDGHWADLIMANLHLVSRGDETLEVEDWENPGTAIRIPLKPTLDARENAEAFYNRQKRARRALERLDEDRKALEKSRKELTELDERLRNNDIGSPPFDSPPPEENKGKGSRSDSAPGLWIHRDAFIIAVGRSAKESDWLLRRWAKGNDTWLHVRDWPGGHVFVRAPRGKSIPLEILLDAGNLALSYSSRSNVAADLYYTQVKNLRRAKNGSTGTVLPSREKNLRIIPDPERLAGLKESAILES